tara:strand:+ start:1199 stop:1738 length:540 start_codon:yes stop_codon:yes gene_type:complete
VDKNIIQVLVGSKNPTKINAVKKAFNAIFTKKQFIVKGKSVPSGVSDQPMSEEETKKGALNRLCYLEKKYSANFYVGIEGGVDYDEGTMVAFAWVYTSNKLLFGKGKTSLFQIPKEIQNLIESGVELGEADDIVFKRKNSKNKDGAVGILTNKNITRTNYYKNAVIMSLIPFFNKKLTF